MFILSFCNGRVNQMRNSSLNFVLDGMLLSNIINVIKIKKGAKLL